MPAPGPSPAADEPAAFAAPVTLHGGGLRLEPLEPRHAAALEAAAADGELWGLPYTGPPAPGRGEAFIRRALDDPRRHAWAVIEEATGDVVGSTSYHDIVPTVPRVEIGYTFYAARCQRTHVNTTCKLLLLEHAFERLGCAVVGWRTDGENHRSQAAIAALGARRDGTIRRLELRKDGVTPRDVVFFSLLAEEWPAARERLQARLARHAAAG